jgi:hypothetical protein
LPDIGKRTLATFEIPAEVVAAIAARNNKPDTGITASWTSPEIALQESAGPFMSVLAWDGKAQAAGARGQYTVSWLGIQSQKLKGDSLDHFIAFGHYGEGKDAYPVNVHKAASSQPFRIEQNQKVTVTLLPNEIKGLVPTRMTLEIRSGIGGGRQGWLVLLQWMLPGLVMVFVWWWLFKREH